jgi:hypothetical protein
VQKTSAVFILLVVTVVSILPAQAVSAQDEGVCGAFSPSCGVDAPWIVPQGTSEKWYIDNYVYDDKFMPLEANGATYVRIWDPEFYEVDGYRWVKSVSRAEQVPNCGDPASPAVAPPGVSFVVSRPSIIAGECAELRWDIDPLDNVRVIYLDNQCVTGHESRQVCPQATTTYTLRVGAEGADINRFVTVNVSPPVAVPATETLLPPSPTPEPPTATLIPPTIEPTITPPPDVPFACIGFGECPTDTPMPSEPGTAPALKMTAFTLADQLTDFQNIQMPTELRPSVLWVQVKNVGLGPLNAPSKGGQYILRVLLKGPGGLLEEYTYEPGNPLELEPLATLKPGDTQTLRINDLFYFTPVEKGEMEVILRPDASLGLGNSTLARPVTVSKHPDSYRDCAATVGQIILTFFGMRLPPAAKVGKVGVDVSKLAKIGVDVSKLGLALSKCNYPGCAAVQVGTWLGVMAVKYLFDVDLGQLLSLGADAGRALQQANVPCLKVADFINAFLRQLLVNHKPVNGVITGSPVYPIVENPTGQRAGYLPDGQVVLEIPGAQAIESGEERIVLYPGLDPVEVRIVGYAVGTMAVTTTFANESGGGSQVVFENVPVTASTVARMSSAEPSRVLEIREGDQAIHTLPPSRVEEVNAGALSTEGAPAQATAVPSTKGPRGLGGDVWSGLAALALLVAACALGLMVYLLRISNHGRWR